METNKISLKEELGFFWEDFVDHSTTHGLININQNKAYFYKLMWLVLFCVSLAFCSYLIVSSINSYLTFEVTTKIKINPENPIKFPIMKICDNNFYSTEYAKDLINQYFREDKIHSPFNITANKKKYMRSQINFLRDLVKKKNTRLSEEERRKLEIEFYQTFLSCSFGNAECSADDFAWKYENTNGNCYIFNSGMDSNGAQIPVLSSTQRGIQYGFRLELLLPPADTYYLDLAKVLRVYVGDSSMEESQYEYIGLSPGFLTNIGIQKTVSRALPYPYSSCNSNPAYSQTDCIDKCYALSYTQYCNCSNADCFTFEEIQCEHDFHDTFFSKIFQNDTCSVACVPKCERTVYDLTISSFEYPSENYADNLMENRDVLFRNQNYSVDKNHLKKNILALLVYWKNLEYTLIEESATTTELDLIANIGGLLGESLI
jgi:hypothetical protein